MNPVELIRRSDVKYRREIKWICKCGNCGAELGEGRMNVEQRMRAAGRLVRRDEVDRK